MAWPTALTTLDALNLTQGTSNSTVCHSNLRFLGLDALSLSKDSVNKDSFFKAFRVYNDLFALTAQAVCLDVEAGPMQDQEVNPRVAFSEALLLTQKLTSAAGQARARPFRLHHSALCTAAFSKLETGCSPSACACLLPPLSPSDTGIELRSSSRIGAQLLPPADSRWDVELKEQQHCHWQL